LLAWSNSHAVAALDGCTNIPLSAGRAQEDDTILDHGVLAIPGFGRPPASVRA